MKMGRSDRWSCERCRGSHEYGPEASLCRGCSLDHVGGLEDLEVVGHHGVQVVLAGGRLVGVAFVMAGEGGRDVLDFVGPLREETRT